MGGTEIERMVIRLQGDTAQYQQMMQQAATQTMSAASQIQQASGRIQGFTSQLQGFGSQAIGVLGQIGISVSALGVATKGIQLAVSAEKAELQFKVLLKSARGAKQRIEELSAFAAATPFELPEVVQASKLLQTFGGSAIATGETLTMVGDMAAASGSSFDNVATWVGRAYSAMQSGRPFGEAGARLQELGLLSGTARQKMEDLQKQGASGAVQWKNFEEVMKTYNGTMKELSESTGGLFSTMQDDMGAAQRTIGEMLIEGLDLKDVMKQISAAAQEVTKYLKTLTPESKKLIMSIIKWTAAVAALWGAWMLLGPMLTLITSLFGPLLMVLGLVKIAILALLTPVGLVVGAIGGALAAVLYFTGAGGEAITWFGQQWHRLTEFMAPAIQGIKDALAKGDIKLAFKILWVQIKITFWEGIEGVKGIWKDFIAYLKSSWAELDVNIANTFKSIAAKARPQISALWEDTKGRFATDIARIRLLLAGATTEESKAAMDAVYAERQRRLGGIQADANAAAAAANEITNNVDAAKARLDALYKERAALLKEAAAPPAINWGKMAEDVAMSLGEIPVTPQVEQPPPLQLKAEAKVDWTAALRNSAEAIARITAYRDRLRMPGTGGQPGTPGHAGGAPGALPGQGNQGGGPPAAQPPVQVVPPPVDPTRDKIVVLLTTAVEHLNTIATKPALNIAAAGLRG